MMLTPIVILVIGAIIHGAGWILHCRIRNRQQTRTVQNWKIVLWAVGLPMIIIGIISLLIGLAGGDPL